MDKKFGNVVKVLGLIFVIVSIVHVFFASCSQRGLYLDGSVFLMQMLDDISNGYFQIISDKNHVRFFVNALQGLPVLALGHLFHVKNKLLLANVYSFAQFLFPVLFLWWNYEITKRTKQYAVLFWSIFIYSFVILQYQIFVIAETVMGVPAQFVLLNYLLGKINYTKADKIGILFLVLLMFGIYEQTIIIGTLIFLCMFPALYDEENPNNITTKIFIGVGSLVAAIYSFIFALGNSSEHADFIRFVTTEAVDFLPRTLGMSLSVCLFSLLVFALVYAGKRDFTWKLTLGISLLYVYFIFRMFAMPQLYFSPVWEQHTRTIICWLQPLIFGGICLYRYKRKDDQFDLIKSAFVPVLLCGITMSVWQMGHTYYWNKNISYMQNELKNCDSPLYIPEEHEEISSFFNKDVRRYIWMANYTSTALIYSPDYKVKNILLPVEDANDDTTPSLREELYVDYENEKMAVPYKNRINIVGDYWDLTDCAEALDKYNKENNVVTNKGK